MVPMPFVLYLLGSSWLSSLTREGFMVLCQSRVTPRLHPPEAPGAGHVATSYKRLTEDGKVRYTAYIRLKGTPGPDLRPEGGRHPMGQAARNRRPDRMLPAQPRSVETDPGGPGRPLHGACPSRSPGQRKGLRPASPLVEGAARVPADALPPAQCRTFVT
jgi:hypothetical protein